MLDKPELIFAYNRSVTKYARDRDSPGSRDQLPPLHLRPRDRDRTNIGGRGTQCSHIQVNLHVTGHYREAGDSTDIGTTPTYAKKFGKIMSMDDAE